MNLPARLFVMVAVLFAGSTAAAITVDDFSVGPLSLTGPSTMMQSPLDSAHVLGGRRDISIDPSGGANHLDVDASSGLMTFASGGSRGYMTLDYGQGLPAPIDMTAGGQDRLQIRFSYVNVGISFGATMTPRDSVGNAKQVDLVGALIASSGHSCSIELPFSATTVDFSHFRGIHFNVIRLGENSTFAIDTIATSGPPLRGDYDRNGVVDTLDYDEWLHVAGKQRFATGVYLTADGNFDGVVDAADYTIWRDNWAPTAMGVSASAPEPAGIILGLLAMIGGMRLRQVYR